MKQYTIIDLEKVLKIIARVDFFSGFTQDEIRTLAGFHQNFVSFEKGDVIINENGNDTFFYILLLGDLSVTKGTPPRLIARLDPGDCFGEVSFLTCSPRTANVVANCHTLTIRVNREMLDSLDIRIREKFKDQLIKRLVERLEQMNGFAVKVKTLLPESVAFPDSAACVP